MRLTRILICWAAGLSAFGPTAAHGATIAWGTATTVSADSDVVTAGTLVEAYNIGNTGVPSTTINGVTFASFAIPNGSISTTVGSLTVSTFATGMTSTAPLGSSSAPFTSLSANYQTLLSTGAVKDTSPPTMDLTFGGLNVGSIYTVQLWANDSRPNSNVISASSGGFTALDPNSTNAEGGVGQYVVGTFTANAATQAINLTGSLPLTNGLQLRTTAIPEPATVSMLLIGAAMMLMRTRKP